MIYVNNLYKVFKSYDVLNGININVKKGEIYGFIGKNGAGKTTTMNILTGLSKPTSGECIINGKNILNINNPSELNIGYLPEEPKFYPWMTAYETIEYLGNSKERRITSKYINEILKWVGLGDDSNRRIKGYSRGMKQRLGIAASLVHDPDIVFLDEPSSALDPQGRSEVLNLINDLKNKEKTIFLSTHILGDIERVCDRVGILSNGKIIIEDEINNIKRDNILPIFELVLKKGYKDEIIDRLGMIDGVIEAKKNKDVIIIKVKNSEYVSKKILYFLSNEEIVLKSFIQKENTLEDIFISEVK